MTTNLLILSFYFVFRYRLYLTYSYNFITILISHGIYVVFFIVVSDITSPTLIITIYTNIILSIIIIIVIIISIIAVIIIIIIIIIINNYWSVITVITSTTIITDIVHIICAVTITIFNWNCKYKNIGSITDSFVISPIRTDSNCKIIYPSNITNRNPTPIQWCRSDSFKGRSVLILSSEET